MALILDTTILALSALEPPPLLQVAGKKLSAPMFFSEAIGEPVLYWSAANLAAQLHDSAIFDVHIVAAFEHQSGARISKFDALHNLLTHGNLGDSVGACSALLLLAEAAEQIMKPARMGLAYDYETLLLDFKSAVRQEFKQGQSLPKSHFMINKAIFQSLSGAHSGLPAHQPKAART